MVTYEIADFIPERIAVEVADALRRQLGRQAVTQSAASEERPANADREVPETAAEEDAIVSSAAAPLDVAGEPDRDPGQLTAPVGNHAGFQGFDMVYVQFQPSIHRIIRRIVGSPDLADDLTQDTFCKALCALAAGDVPDNLPAWLYTIARNTAYDALRHGMRSPWTSDVNANDTERKLPGSHCSPEDQIAVKDELNNILGSIGTRHAVRLILHHYYELSVKEIASIQGSSEPVTATLLDRARKAASNASKVAKETGTYPTPKPEVDPMECLLLYESGLKYYQIAKRYKITGRAVGRQLHTARGLRDKAHAKSADAVPITSTQSA